MYCSELGWGRVPRASSSSAMAEGVVLQFLIEDTKTEPILRNALFLSTFTLNRYILVPSKKMTSEISIAAQGIPNPRPQLRLSCM